LSDTPKLSNDCFALPAGEQWTPVETALTLLRERVERVTGSEEIASMDAGGRILAQAVTAGRDNPPKANSAMDGYAFAQTANDSGPQNFTLVDGRAAAGVPFEGIVPAGKAVRILTGAIVPDGVDTVVMQEDVTREGQLIRFGAGLQKGANVRPAGEDMKAGAVLFETGRALDAPDLGVLATAGVARVQVFKRLRVGVLSTGEELRQPGEVLAAHQIYDANRPMLLELLRRWGLEAVDLGHVRDDASAVRACLDRAARTCDAVLTSGGASAGDEDHVSAILQREGRLDLWRIAIKPGRPLALGMWHNIPVFGLPGNPVASFVTALVFARPYLRAMGGAGWQIPSPVMLQAAFEKRRKPGRREYLRGRINADGQLEAYHSEGSGHIAGLSWAEGLIELTDDCAGVKAGQPVRFYPYGAFGI